MGSSLLQDPRDPSHGPLPMFLVQAFIVLALTRFLGKVLKYLKQPQVIGEIIGGIILGPTVLGRIPAWQQNIFPKSSLAPFGLVATLGLIFFMFFLGIELDPELMRRQVKVALPIAISSVLTPFAIGAGLSIWIFEKYSTDAVDFSAFVLFFGAAMSFTAFPVLASILQANRLIVDPLGVLALSCAAIDDLAAWCLLAFTTAYAAGGDAVSGIYTALISLAYVLFMLFPVRLLLDRLHRHYGYSEESSPDELDNLHVSMVCMMLLVSAFFAETIGVHAFFGAFIAGVVVPKTGTFVHMLAPRVELLVMDFLLPLYFANSGLKLNMGSIDSGDVGPLVAILVCACVGKFVPTFVMTRLIAKLPFRLCASLGILMNTRGLVQLIVLNIGMDLKILTERLFSLMVIMALVTTMLTPPSFHIMYVRHLQKNESLALPKIRHALLSAAGRPTALDARWGHECLILVQGKPLLVLLLGTLQNVGIEQVTLVVPRGDVRIRECLRRHAAFFEKCSVEVVESRGDENGFYAYSLVAASERLSTKGADDTILLVTVDHLFENSVVREFANIDLEDRWDGVVLADDSLNEAVGCPPTAAFLKFDDDKVQEIGTDVAKPDAVQVGLMALRASVFFSKLSELVTLSTIGEKVCYFSLSDVLNCIAKEGRLSFRFSKGRQWVDVKTLDAVEVQGATDKLATMSSTLSKVIADSEDEDLVMQRKLTKAKSFHDIMEVTRRRAYSASSGESPFPEEISIVEASPVPEELEAVEEV